MVSGVIESNILEMMVPSESRGGASCVHRLFTVYDPDMFLSLSLLLCSFRSPLIVSDSSVWFVLILFCVTFKATGSFQVSTCEIKDL